MTKHYSEKEIEKMGAELNKLYTSFQKLDIKIDGWRDLCSRTDRKWKLLKTEQQILENKRATNWYIRLTIANIILLIATLCIQYVTLMSIK